MAALTALENVRIENNFNLLTVKVLNVRLIFFCFFNLFELLYYFIMTKTFQQHSYNAFWRGIPKFS